MTRLYRYDMPCHSFFIIVFSASMFQKLSFISASIAWIFVISVSLTAERYSFKTVHTVRAGAGINLIYIRDFLRHEDCSTTEIYARIDTGLKRKAIEKAYKEILPEQEYIYKRWKRDISCVRSVQTQSCFQRLSDDTCTWKTPLPLDPGYFR